jgi:uncharacterized metal-binding protein YceD (DUF177 family)
MGQIMTARPPAKTPLSPKTPRSPKTPWSLRVRRETVPEGGLHFDLVADEATRAAVAAAARVRALPRLVARFDVGRHGGGLRVAGEVSATVGQTCVVTLEPIESEINEAIDLVFVPAAARSSAAAEEAPELIDPEAADEPEILVDGAVDLGAIATEFLLLGIEPYPRKPGVMFEPPTVENAGTNPFAALAALKKNERKTED